ncbi:MAG: UDP-N-acetylmuramyl pentapeptide phosphotransferase [Syntrophobacteraceae bacterium]
MGILAAFCLTALLSGTPVSLWAPVCIMALIAGVGDRVDLPVRLRLTVQLGLSSVLVLGAAYSSTDRSASLLLIPFWIVFIAGTANFYNFMDGINGIAGIAGVVGFSLLFLYMDGLKGRPGLGALSLCMAFSCLGFLPLNMPRAKIFMGDVGSILLGAAFASIVFLGSRTFLDFLCTASFLSTFYADELSTMAVRIKGGENLLRAHREHLYQLLANEYGIAHWRISAAYGAMQALIGIIVLLVRPFGVMAVTAVLVLWSCLFVTASHCVRNRLKQVQPAYLPCKPESPPL